MQSRRNDTNSFLVDEMRVGKMRVGEMRRTRIFDTPIQMIILGFLAPPIFEFMIEDGKHW